MSLSEPMRHGQTSNAMGKILPMKTWIILFLAVSGALAHAHNYKYSDLVIRDYDEMNKDVQLHISNAHKKAKGGDDTSGDREAIDELRDALKLIFSRPNSDNMVAKLTPDVRRELSNFSAFEDTISGISAECLSQVKDDSLPVVVRSTALFVLENLLSEIRPEVAGNADLRRVTQRIADAKIKVPEDVLKDRKLRSMFKTVNPSDFAQEILKKLPKTEAK
jgi:hypothetical protein